MSFFKFSLAAITLTSLLSSCGGDSSAINVDYQTSSGAQISGAQNSAGNTQSQNAQNSGASSSTTTLSMDAGSAGIQPPTGVCEGLSPEVLSLGLAQSFEYQANETKCFVMRAELISASYDSLRFQVYGKDPKPKGQVKISPQDQSLKLGSMTLPGEAETMNVKIPLNNSHQKYAPYYVETTLEEAGTYRIGWAINDQNPQYTASSAATISSSMVVEAGKCNADNSTDLTQNNLHNYAAEADETHCFRMDPQTAGGTFETVVVRFGGSPRPRGIVNTFATDNTYKFQNPTTFTGLIDNNNVNYTISNGKATLYGPFYLEITYSEKGNYTVGWALNKDDLK